MFSGVRRWYSLAFAILAAALACAPRDKATAPAAPTAAIELVDDVGDTIRLPRPASRIISLIPSATEALIAIGATPQIVARTRYDVDSAVLALPSVGGGLDPSVEAMVSLKPDLVISWESDKRQLVRERLTALGIPVYILRAQDTSDVFRGLEHLGRMAGRDSAATAVAHSIRATLDSVRTSVAGLAIPTVMYAEFIDPPMTPGPKTFIGQLITLAGGRSVFDDTDQLWPNVSLEEIIRRDPDLIVVPLGDVKEDALEMLRARQGWRGMRAVREGRVIAVSADLMSRPGPSIALAARTLRAAFHPEFAVR